jgi:hypothetical protein
MQVNLRVARTGGTIEVDQPDTRRLSHVKMGRRRRRQSSRH